MAIPPEPIDEIFPDVDGCVVGEVTVISHQWKQEPLPQPKGKVGADLPGELAQQTVKLKIERAVFGSYGGAGDEIEVSKPRGDYTLRPGNKGPFLLRGARGSEKHPVIVGRYGPDSYRLDVIESAAQRHKKS